MAVSLRGSMQFAVLAPELRRTWSSDSGIAPWCGLALSSQADSIRMRQVCVEAALAARQSGITYPMRMRKSLFRPGWSKSWQAAAM